MEQQTIALSLLDLDPENPRLPEGVETDQEFLLRYIFQHGSLRELADSFIDNGFFEAERLIVIERAEGGRFIVVEGNRRLAALKILHGELEDVAISSNEPSGEELDSLIDIPCLVVATREEVDEYLAYRHIGGMKTWSAEARARFTRRMVDKEMLRGDQQPFRTVGRQVGSNSQGIRNSYLAIIVLEYARDELSLDTDYLQFERFGVWIRCMNSTDIRTYLGVGNPTTYEHVVETLRTLDGRRLAEVVSDLSVRPEGRRPLVSDSRDITAYGRILTDSVAYESLRKHQDFEIARQIVERRNLPTRLERISVTISAVTDELSKPEAAQVDADLLVQAERLYGAARSLRAIVRDLVEDGND